MSKAKMSKAKAMMVELAAFYEANRLKGHTTAMLCGVLGNNAVTVVACSGQVKEIHEKRQVVNMGMDLKLAGFTVSSNSVAAGSLRKRRGPLVIDNAALHMLFVDAVEDMNKLEQLNYELNIENAKLKSALAASETCTVALGNKSASPGELVEYVISKGVSRPALVTRCLRGCVNGRQDLNPVALTVFLALGDLADTMGGNAPTMMKMPVWQDETTQEVGTWHHREVQR